MVVKKRFSLFFLLIFIFSNCFGLLLFDKYPELKSKVPYISLGSFPTPVKKLFNFGKILNHENIYLKNDSLSGSNLFGGNKVRKLEFLLGQALNNKSKSVITCGSAGSNSALASVTWANYLGFNTYSMLCPQLPTFYTRRNLLLTKYYGAKISYFDSFDKVLVGIERLSKKLKEKDGVEPTVIPIGGSSPLGSLGFVNAAFELKEQIDNGILPEPDYIYVCLGSAGTSAGLILGAKLAGLKSKIIPVGNSGDSNGNIEFRTKRLVNKLNEVSKFLMALDQNIKLEEFKRSDFENRYDFASYKYAQVCLKIASNISCLYNSENIKLDGTYAGKAFTAMVGDLISKKDLKNKVILFWNTYCSGDFLDIVNQVNYKDLPKELHVYFENEMQEFDRGA